MPRTATRQELTILAEDVLVKNMEGRASTADYTMIMFVLSLLMLMGHASAQLNINYYQKTCPDVLYIVQSIVQQAVEQEPRMAASLLHMHFHDCFVNGCDASVLLDDTHSFKGEKSAFPNLNSLRGFNVIDNIKAALERECKETVSCADILAIATRDSVVLVGGPYWPVFLGRRDSTTASEAAANQDLPGPADNLSAIISKFEAVGLSAKDVVVLSGAHTIGRARCVTFSSRLYNYRNTGEPDPSLDITFLNDLQGSCPRVGNANALVPLDRTTQDTFDNKYFVNVQEKEGLLETDQELLSESGATMSLVNEFARDAGSFFTNFGFSMIKMGNIRPLTGNNGEIRTNCSAVNKANPPP